jgi:hypothetical protein
MRAEPARRGALGPARALARDAWWACSAPLGFFGSIEAQGEPRPSRAALAAGLSVALALGVLSIAFVLATASDGLLIVYAAALALGMPAFALVLLLGGLVMVRPAALDVRAWEVAAWAWTPAGALALSLLPAVFVAPGVAALAGTVAFPVWHVVVLTSGLRVLAPTRLGAATASYLVAVLLVPAILGAIGFAIVRGAP